MLYVITIFYFKIVRDILFDFEYKCYSKIYTSFLNDFLLFNETWIGSPRNKTYN